MVDFACCFPHVPPYFLFRNWVPAVATQLPEFLVAWLRLFVWFVFFVVYPPALR